MSELVLRDIDPELLAGIERVAGIHGWSQSRTVRVLLERGLHALLGDDARELAPAESDVLRAAISAMEDVPDDAGFAMIGRNPET
ncbi:hypothetical protein LDO26_07485 [Luteimonas sp. BDR2-5]|uniref:hypothetical protein n=1 Tax=Proluteimonas luteida TaxID=2878685 RepID=UPI001E4F3E1E|nr:hypothetical protein [Luteimonas sp. BDR2-5]MCD9028048.1 hypothetical protein [Luteimonas sp. BDR2-5]